MEWMFILLGALAAAAFYLYFINKFHENSGKLKNVDFEVRKEEQKEVKLEPKPEELKRKFCPLCNTLLGKNDSLYAEMFKDASPRSKVVIHGCRYCFIPAKKR